MPYKIDRYDLIKLVASTPPSFKFFDHPLYNHHGQWPEHITLRELRILKELDDGQLHNLYQLSKNSYWSNHSKERAGDIFTSSGTGR